MLKFYILSVLLIVKVVAQHFVDYTKCIGLNHGTQISVGHEFSCTKYYFCSQGIGILEDCTEIYGDKKIAFDERTNYCGYNVECRIPDRATTTTLAPTVAISPRFNAEVDDNVNCPLNRPSEILLLPSFNCSQFFICSNGSRMLMSCLKGLFYNEDKKKCDDPAFSRCASRRVRI